MQSIIITNCVLCPSLLSLTIQGLAVINILFIFHLFKDGVRGSDYKASNGKMWSEQ